MTVPLLPLVALTSLTDRVFGPGGRIEGEVDDHGNHYLRALRGNDLLWVVVGSSEEDALARARDYFAQLFGAFGKGL